MGKRLVVLAAFCVVALLGTGSAFGGERGGNGEPTPVNDYRAGSICSFSGLEDFDFEAPVQPGVTQHPAPGDLHGGDNACKGYAAGGGE
jgi:hypothetical protein